MPAIDAVKAHYRAYLDGNRPNLAVPEWSEEGRPVVVFWKPFTLGDHARVFGGERKPDNRAYAEVVQHKAENREGKKLFPELADLHVLTYEADRSVVERIAGAIMEAPALRDEVRRLQEDRLRLNMFALAEKLGKTFDEIAAMPMTEYIGWMAYHKVKEDAA